jgi:uncharacterized protein
MDTDKSSDPHDKISMLSSMQARVLGSLMEKQLTTPDQYPLTLNSLQLACNQKTNREPLSNYETGQLQRCVSELQDTQLISVDYGARAARYDQRLTRVLSVDKSTQAILTVLLLRGAQTVSEILMRTQRMFDFGGPQELEEKLQQLCAKTKPIIVHISRQAGQREDRYMHLLCGQPDLAAIAAKTEMQARHMASDDYQLELEKKIVLLEEKMQLLENKVAELMQVKNTDI